MAKKSNVNYTKGEFEAYLLHERGHLNFIGRLMSAVYALIIIFIVFFLYLIILFINWEKYNLMLETIFFTFIFLLLGWLLNGVREYYADYYSWTCSGNKKALISALRKIDRYKRSNAWASMIRNYTHPPLESRIRLIERTKC